jgi:RNA polymerase sigma-70 factor (ECF subfamily)
MLSRRLARSGGQRRARQTVAGRGVSGGIAADPWEAQLDVAAAHADLACLAAHHRAALTLRYLDGLPVADVARELGRSCPRPGSLGPRHGN